MRKTLIKLVFSIFILLSMISFSNAAVEVFSLYDTTLKVNSNNTIEVSKHLKIKNVYDVGIVPGQIEFKIGRGTEGSIANIDILSVTSKDVFGNNIKNQVRTSKDHSTIILDIYYPLLPGFEYEFNLDYVLSYEPGGIFFKSLQIPLRESTIPIQKGKFEVVLPENYYFTHLSSNEDNATINKNVAYWNIKDDLPSSVSFEYSYLPIKIGSFKGSYVFWIIINLILVMILIFEIKKEIRKVKKQYEQ